MYCPVFQNALSILLVLCSRSYVVLGSMNHTACRLYTYVRIDIYTVSRNRAEYDWIGTGLMVLDWLNRFDLSGCVGVAGWVGLDYLDGLVRLEFLLDWIG